VATIERTGAEDVAWNLADLYAGGADDPGLERDVARCEEDAAAFRDRYLGRVAELDAPALVEAIEERQRIDEVLTRAAYFAHLNFSTNMADPPRGALVARLTEKEASLGAELLFFTLELAALPEEAADLLRAVASLAAGAAEVPPASAVGAGGARRDREVGLGCLGLVAPVRGAARCAPRHARRGGGRARDGDVTPVRRRP
jgi:hypothetical protein